MDWNDCLKYYMEQRSKIILTRKTEWLNRLRGYRFFIDGNESGKIKNGSTEEFVIDPGTHKVQCKLNWCVSREFEVSVQPGETSYLLVKSGLKYFWIFYILLLAGLGYNLYYTFAHIRRPSYVSNLVWILILPAVLYMLYYLTIGRKDYLIVGKDSKNIFA